MPGSPCRTPGLRAFRRDRSAAAAVEFALIAPALLAALVLMVDVGLALNDRMRMDAILRAASQEAMRDPGLADLQAKLSALATDTGFAVAVALHCPCEETPHCTVPCVDPDSYTAYHLSASGTYSSLLTPITIDMSSQMEVRVR